MALSVEPSASRVGSPQQQYVAMRDLPALTWVPIAAMTAVLLATLVVPQRVSAWALPITIVGGLVGIPHGAVDHMVDAWSGGWTTWLRRALQLIAYVGVAAAAVVCLVQFPTPTLVVFLVASAVHFGRGEAVTSAERRGVARWSGWTDRLLASAHGLVVVGLLLWAAPDEIDPYLRPMSAWLADAVGMTARVGVALAWVTVAIACVALLRVRRRLEVVELVLLLAVFSIAPPLAAFGVYFGAWHALRHTGRLLDLARGERIRSGRLDPSWAPAVTQLFRVSVVPSVLSLGAVAVLWGYRDVAGLQAVVAVLLALTFPHTVVIAVLDRRSARGRPPVGDLSNV